MAAGTRAGGGDHERGRDGSFGRPPDAAHRREWVLVGLMVASALMSAYSFWRASTFGAEAATQRRQELVATTLAAQDARHFGALVDFDLGLTTRYCSATSERDAALVDSLPGMSGEIGPVVDEIVTQHLTAESRWSLFQAYVPDQSCAVPSGGDPGAAYSVENALEWQVATNPRFGSGGVQFDHPDGGDPSRSEQRLMVAALAFAVALMFLTVADLVAPADPPPSSLGGSAAGRRRGWLVWSGLAAVAVIAGLTLVILEAPVIDLLVWGAVLLVAVVVPAVWASVMVRHRVSPSAAPLHAQRGPRRPVRWKAELAGAVTLVGLAASALGLSLVAGRERDVRAEADRQTVTADQLLEEGEQDALRDLLAVDELAELDARRAAANQAALEPAGEAERIAASRAAVASHAADLEDGADGEGAARPAGSDAPACPGSPAERGRDPEKLLADAHTDPTALSDHIAAQSEAGTACNVHAATSRAAADVWDRWGDRFTVALVVLGLAGFLLALAADPDRSLSSARWLLRMGVLGGAIGGLVAASAAFSAATDGDAAGRPAGPGFAEHVAAGQVALRQGDCDGALRHLDAATNARRDYGPAFVSLAEAQICSPDDDWLFGAAIDPPRVDAALRDLSTARDLGAADPTSALDTGWLQVLKALHDPGERDASLAAALDSTREARDQMIGQHVGGVHYARFNLALTHLLLGDDQAAALYEEAVGCLQPDTCRGGGLHDEVLRRLYALMALADLELVDEPSAALDDYRSQIIDGVDPSAPTEDAGDGDVPDLGEWTLDVFPQELQVVPTDDLADLPISVVWYYRERSDVPWSVIIDASVQTLVPGTDTTGRPIAVGRYLPAGQYRADLLVGGRMAESVHTEPPGHEPPAGYERVVVPELGFAAEVPDAWQRSDYAYGLETGFRSIGSEGSLVIRRAETMMPDAEVERWVSRTLDAWVADVLGVEQLGEVDDSEEPWAFGADHRVERDYPDIGAWATMGFSPYIAGHPECGGTAFMAMTEGADPETTSFIRDSLVVQQSLPGIQALDETTAMSGFSIDLSDDWALLAPATSGDAGMVLRAHDCATGARVEIGVRESGGRSLDASVDAVVERHASELAGFELDDRRAVQLPSGEAAIEIDSSFVADALDVSQRELIALDGGDLYLVTVTTPAGGVGDDVVDEVIGTFALTGT